VSSLGGTFLLVSYSEALLFRNPLTEFAVDNL